VAADGERAGLDGHSGRDTLDAGVAVDLEVVVTARIVGEDGGGGCGTRRLAAAGGGRHGEASLSCPLRSGLEMVVAPAHEGLAM